MNVSKLLRQPYPVPESAGNEWIIGAFIGGFLLLFQPFGISIWQTSDKALKVLGFGVITTATMLLFNEGTRLIPRFFAENGWTVGREIAKILVLILLIAVGNRLYLGWLFHRSAQGGWLQTLGMTFLIGILPTIGVVLTNYIVQLRRYEQGAAHLLTYVPTASSQNSASGFEIGPVLNPEIAADQQIALLAENEKDALTFHRDDLLAIESSDNYCTVFYLKNGSLTKELMRSSLSRLETQLGDDSSFVRCHRSYLVNLEQVSRVSGNAQGYKLHLFGNQLTVPVARKYNDTLVAGLK